MMAELCQIQAFYSLSEEKRASLCLLYEPLAGREAICLYDVMYSLGRKHGEFSLEDLQKIAHLSPTRFTYARKQLEQYDLIQTYREPLKNSWCFVMQLPKDPIDFLQHDVYSRLFLEKEGSAQLDRMKLFFSCTPLCSKTMVNISEPLDVSALENWTQDKEKALEKTTVKTGYQSHYAFDFNLLFKGMDRVIPQRLRTRENLERIYDLARIFGVDERSMRRYLNLSIDAGKSSIDFEALRNKVLSAHELHTQTQDPYTLAPVAYLQYRQNDMPVARADKILIEKLMVDYQLPSEVINVLIDYALKATNQKFSRSFVEKVASSWARLKIDTKEKAIEQTVSYKQNKVEDVPDWYADTKQRQPDEQLKQEIAQIQEELRKEKHGED